MTAVELRSADGARIMAEAHGDGPVTFVMAHGLTGNRSKTGVRLITQWLAAHGRVVVFDQRGHGESSGACTLAYREPMDLDAAVAWARSLAPVPVVTIGFSLGASVAVRHAALTTGGPALSPKDATITVRERPDATVVVSGVGEWFYRGSHIMDRMFRLTATPWGRFALRASQGIRVSVRDWGAGPGAAEAELPTSPVAAAASIAHPLLLVHGDHDHYFPPEHSERLHAAARAAGNQRAAVWIEQGMGHAERGTTQDLIDRIAQWATSAVLDDDR